MPITLLNLKMYGFLTNKKMELRRRNMQKKIRIGVVAAGAIATKYHIPGYLSCDNVEIIGISDLNQELATKVAQKYGIKNVYTDYKDLLAQKPDAISICTPNRFHAAIAIEALNKNINVLCEKPLAMNMEECKALEKAEQDSEAFLMVEFPMRYDRAYQKAHELIEKGVLGKITIIKSTWNHGGPEKWSPNGSWFYKPELAGGGALADLGVHNIDIVRFLAGGNVQMTKSFCKTQVKDSTLEDSAVVILCFENQVLGIVDASWCTGPQQVKTEIQGTNGRMELFGWPTNTMKLTLEGELEGVFEPVFSSNKGEYDPHIICVRKFVECVKEGRPPLSGTIEDGIQALEIISKAYNDKMTI